MEFKGIKFVALCLGVALLLVAGTAMAGTTVGPAGATGFKFAREVGANNVVYTMPAGTVVRNMSVIRSIAQDMFVDITLVGGATFATGRLPANGDLLLTETSGNTTYPATVVSGGLNGSTTVRYFINIVGTDMDTLGILTLTVTNWTIRDPGNVLGGGGLYNVTMNTTDAATNTPFDTGNDTAVLMSGVFGTAAGSLVSTTAIVDVGTNRKNFVAGAINTLTVNNGATMGFDNSVANVLQANGQPYTLIHASTISVLIGGDLTGISNITWNPGALFGGAVFSHNVTAAERTAQLATISLFGDDPAITNINAVPIAITVDGATILTARTLTLAANLVLSGGADGPAANNRSLFSASTLTTWTLNGTILVANMANGNTAFWNSRFYLWNPSPTQGQVTVRVFTLPVSGGANTQVGTTVIIGTMAATSGLNVRLAEDILTPAGVTLPYVTNGGNVVVEFTIEANNVRDLLRYSVSPRL